MPAPLTTAAIGCAAVFAAIGAGVPAAVIASIGLLFQLAVFFVAGTDDAR